MKDDDDGGGMVVWIDDHRKKKRAEKSVGFGLVFFGGGVSFLFGVVGCLSPAIDLEVVRRTQKAGQRGQAERERLRKKNQKNTKRVVWLARHEERGTQKNQGRRV